MLKINQRAVVSAEMNDDDQDECDCLQRQVVEIFLDIFLG